VAHFVIGDALSLFRPEQAPAPLGAGDHAFDRVGEIIHAMPGRMACSRKAFRSAGIVPNQSGKTKTICSAH